MNQLSSMTSTGSETSSQNRSLLAQIGLLAGGVLGGLVLVGIGIFIWVLIARRWSKKKALLTVNHPRFQWMNETN